MKPLARTPPATRQEAADRDEVALMVAASQGSKEAFADLVRHHERPLLNFFRKLGAHPEEAEDAVQETCLRIWVYRGRYRPGTTFRTFLFTVAHHAWLDLCRRRDRHRRRQAPGLDPSVLAGEAGISAGDRLDLEAGLRALPEGQRLVVVLSVFGGLRYEEIASMLKIPEGTVKSRVFHALRKLRVSLGDASSA